MPTGQVIVNNALSILGILEQGGVPSNSDSVDSLGELNSMWSGWGIDEGLIFAVAPQQFVWGAAVGFNSIGPTAGAPFNVPLPSRIYRAGWISADGTRRTLQLASQDKYFAHSDLSATAKVPEECYANFLVAPAAGTAGLNAWPVPSVGGTLELQTGAPFSVWTLASVYDIPQGYQDPIQWALAFRLIPRFGMSVSQQVVETVTMMAPKAEARIREANRINRQLQAGAERAPGSPPEAGVKP